MLATPYLNWADLGQLLLAGWLTAGELLAIEEVHEGLESAPSALLGLLAGHNLGKVIVRVDDDPDEQAET